MKNLLALLSTIPLLSACWYHGPTRVEEEFGLSVRQMVDEQIFTPGDVVRTKEQSPQPLGGAEAVKTIDRYNQSAKRAALKNKTVQRSPAR